MDFQFIQMIWRLIEVTSIFVTSVSMLVIAVCAVIHAFRTRPARQVALFRNAFKIKAR